MSRSKKSCKLTGWLVGILLFVASAFRFRQKDEEESIHDAGEHDAEEPAEHDLSPKVTYYFEHVDEPLTTHIEHEIKIDLKGCLYFKIGGKWKLQGDIEEINAYNLRTVSRMGDTTKQRALREDV